jgi:hypothetical protein
MKILLAALALLLVADFSRADEIYTYTGPQPSDLSGSFTTQGIVSSGVPSDVISFSFTDGLDTWTPANSTFGGTFLVNPDGSFLVWGFNIEVKGQLVAYSQTQYSPFYYEDYTPIGDSWVANQFSFDKPKGSWTMAAVSTPEPGTLALLGVGLLGLLARKRLQVKRTQVPEAVWEPLS